MSIGVSTEFIDLSDGNWHLLPSNAINIVFETKPNIDNSDPENPLITNVHVDILTSHNGQVPHEIHSLNTATDKGDHFAINSNLPDVSFILQMVKIVPKSTSVMPDYVRVYFGRAK